MPIYLLALLAAYRGPPSEQPPLPILWPLSSASCNRRKNLRLYNLVWTSCLPNLVNCFWLTSPKITKQTNTQADGQ